MSGMKRGRKDDAEDYDSSFEDDEDEVTGDGAKKSKRRDLTIKEPTQPGSSKSHTAGIF